MAVVSLLTLGMLFGRAARGEDGAGDSSPALRVWVRKLQGQVRNGDGSAPEALVPWSVVGYLERSGKGESAPARIVPLTDKTWRQRTLTAVADGDSAAYSLGLNDPALLRVGAASAADGDNSGDDVPGAVLARSLMLLAGADFALQFGPGVSTSDPIWRLWHLSQGQAELLHAARPVTTAEGLEENAAAFLRQALGYDAIIVAADGDDVLARVIETRARVGQTALVLEGSEELLRVPDERQRRAASLLKVTALSGSWARLRVLAAPKIPVFSPGTKLVLDAGARP